MSLQDLLLDLQALEKELYEFEHKYGRSSEAIYTAYLKGAEPEDDAWTLDFGEWASVYKTWLTRQADYQATLGPSESEHCLALAHTKPMDSVEWHRQRQATLDRKSYFAEVLGAADEQK